MPIITTDIVTTLSALPEDRLIKLVEYGEQQFVSREFAINRARIHPQGYKLITRGATVRKMIAIEKQTRFIPCWRNTEAAAFAPWPGWDTRTQS